MTPHTRGEQLRSYLPALRRRHACWTLACVRRRGGTGDADGNSMQHKDALWPCQPTENAGDETVTSEMARHHDVRAAIILFLERLVDFVSATPSATLPSSLRPPTPPHTH